MIRRQLLASVSSFLGVTCSGMTMAFTSTLLPQIYEYVEYEKGSWLASINILSQLFGICVGSLLLNQYGRKPCLTMVNVSWFIGWIWLSWANDFWIFLTGCLVVGTSAGVHTVSASVYLTEMFGDRSGSIVLAFTSLCYVFGILTQNFVGTILNWQDALHISAVVPLLSFLAAFYTVESPEWLILNQQSDRAKEILSWIHSAEGNEEFDRLLAKNTVQKSSEGTLKTYGNKQFLHSFLVVLLILLVRVFSCFDTITVYSVDMIESMSRALDGHWTSILTGEVAVISCAISSIYVERESRRSVFFISSLGVLLSLLAISVILAFNFRETHLVIFLCAYQVAANIGMLTIPWLLVQEIFPETMRQFGCASSNILFYFFTFLAVKMNPYFMERISMALVFLTNASLLSACLVILYFIMPETLSRTQ